MHGIILLHTQHKQHYVVSHTNTFVGGVLKSAEFFGFEQKLGGVFRPHSVASQVKQPWQQYSPSFCREERFNSCECRGKVHMTAKCCAACGGGVAKVATGRLVSKRVEGRAVCIQPHRIIFIGQEEKPGAGKWADRLDWTTYPDASLFHGKDATKNEKVKRQVKTKIERHVERLELEKTELWRAHVDDGMQPTLMVAEHAFTECE